VGTVVIVIAVSRRSTQLNLEKGKLESGQLFVKVKDNLNEESRLLKSMVVIVKQYSTFEKEIFMEMLDASDESLEITTAAEAYQAFNSCIASLNDLYKIVSYYPLLTIDPIYLQCEIELENNKKALERNIDRYNSQAKDYNDSLQRSWAKKIAEKRGLKTIPLVNSKQVSHEAAAPNRRETAFLPVD
jgi:hypothetical protein